MKPDESAECHETLSSPVIQDYPLRRMCTVCTDIPPGVYAQHIVGSCKHQSNKNNKNNNNNNNNINIALKSGYIHVHQFALSFAKSELKSCAHEYNYGNIIYRLNRKPNNQTFGCRMATKNWSASDSQYATFHH